jgi:hypothetical protein
MRWYKITVLFLFLSIAIFFAAAESGPGQRFLQKKLLEAFENSGIKVEAEQFGGKLPKKIDLKNARIEVDGALIQIDHLSIELSLFPLMQKELSIEKFRAEGVRFDRIPDMQKSSSAKKLPFALKIHSFQIEDFEWPSWPALGLGGDLKIERSGLAFLNLDITGPIEVHASAKGTLENFSGKARGLYENFSFKTRLLKKKGAPFEFLQLVISESRGRVQGQVSFDVHKHFAKADLQLKTKWEKEPISADVTIEGVWTDDSFDGNAKTVGQFLQETWTLNSPVYASKAKGIGLKNFHLQSPLFDGNGQLFWKDGKVFGAVESELDLSLVPNYSLSGHLTSKIDFNDEIEGNATIKNLMVGSLYMQQVSIQGRSEKAVNIDIWDARWKHLNLDTASLSAAKGEENWSVFLTLAGPAIAAQSKGYFRQNQIILEEASGQYLDVPFWTEIPSFIAWSDQGFSWKPFALQIGENGSFSFSLERRLEKTEIQAKLQKFPLEFLSSAIRGGLDLSAQVQEINGETSGHLKASTSNAEVLLQADTYIPTNGRLEASLDGTRLSFQSNLESNGSPLASLDLELPIHVGIWPLEGKIYPNGPASGSLFLDGKIEEVLDFFRLGMHRLAGDAVCKMSMTGSLSNPRMEGSCKIKNGSYENYLTGTELTNLSAQIEGEGNQLHLTAFTAKDALKKGNFTASGNVRVSLPDYFPFHFDIDFTRMNIVQIDLITAEAEGHLAIDGNLKSALAKGRIEIVEAEITIPDKIPRSYPDLQVVYKNARVNPPLPAESPSLPYPLHLEIAVSAPEGVFIDGRGLQSEWHGEFNVGGQFTSPSAQGKLELVNGEFVFVGRRFKLTEGSLSLKGKAYEMPSINLAGTASEKGISITAHLAGPLNKPQITFQSSPPLPMSGILSYLLFGQDLSEVSGIQALQLAGTIATFAGEGPDILEMTRKSLGVDRLQIVMTPSGAEGEETIALQVGKIVFPGFLVTIKQGADDSSPNIAIEVDLTHGFTFVAESEQQPEQGKFSILWNLNY